MHKKNHGWAAFLAAVVVFSVGGSVLLGAKRATHILTVESTTPNSGVPMTVWTADVGGLKNGNTTFTREYNEGTTVSVTAPQTVGTKWFSSWAKDGILDLGSARTVAVTMNGNHTINATYVQGYSVSIGSSTPNSGVPISVWTRDLTGQTHGTTPFARSYLYRTTMSVTAPGVVGTSYFLRWDRQGSPWLAQKTVNLPIYADSQLTAVYAQGMLLTISSENAAGVPITVWTTDKAGQKNGSTPFTRLFATGFTASATAPATASGKAFVRWDKDGVPVPGTSKTISVPMDTVHTISAVYAP